MRNKVVSMSDVEAPIRDDQRSNYVLLYNVEISIITPSIKGKSILFSA